MTFGRSIPRALLLFLLLGLVLPSAWLFLYFASPAVPSSQLKRIKFGMTEHDVKSILGPPTSIWRDGYEIDQVWTYQNGTKATLRIEISVGRVVTIDHVHFLGRDYESVIIRN